MRSPQLHFVLVPWISHGHVIPMMDIARLLARRSILVTVIITPVNAARIRTAVIDPAEATGLPIRFVELRLPCAEAGLPEGCETTEQIMDPTLFPKLHFAVGLLRGPLESYLRGLPEHRPSCIIADVCHPWTRDVAGELRIPLLLYYVSSCFTNLCCRSLRRHNLYDDAAYPTEPFPVPDLPQIEVTRAQAQGTFDKPGWEWLRDQTVAAEAAAAGALFNSFDELEPGFLPKFQELVGLKTWAIGPLSLSNKDLAERGITSAVDAGRCLSWLDSMKPESVIFVCFGTNTFWIPPQIIEVGAGLEDSGHSFIWVFNERELTPEIEGWLSAGFEERTRSRALIIKGWAPQSAILTHPAIGGFITHCGWNSSIEGVAAGVPMITWPHYEDQFLNDKMIVEVSNVVKRGEVERAVRGLLGGGEEGEGRRKRARELGEMARKAMEEGGSSCVNLNQLIDFIAKYGVSDE